MASPDDHEQDLFEDPGPRSIFAATWFRVVLVVIVFAVIGAVAVPYILDYMNPPSKPVVASRPAVAPPRPSVPAAQPPATTVMPASPSPTSAAPAQAAPPARTAPAAPPPAVAQAPKPAPAPPAAEKPTPPKAKAPAASETKAMAKDEPKPAPKARAAAKRAAVAKAAPGGSGSYWVQLGAFRDEETAKRLATRLGMPNVTVMSARVAESTAAARPPAAATPPAAQAPAEPKDAGGGGDLYDVFVSGGAPGEISRRLAGKGLASDATAGGVVIRPSQPLRDAVTLSKDLAVEGFKVQVRRAGGQAPRPAAGAPPTPPAPRAAAPSAGDALHRVRVGPYAERAAAVAALRELDAKGYKGFIARGEP
jgi:hypothetical protein